MGASQNMVNNVVVPLGVLPADAPKFQPSTQWGHDFFYHKNKV